MSQTAQRRQILEYRTHPLAGKAPDGHKDWKEFAASIPYYSIVDFEELVKGDPDPFFMTLDVFVVGATSENGLFYSEEFVQTLESQLPGKGGNFGHTYGWDSDPEAIHWVGHKRVYMEGKSTTYAKFYIGAGIGREYLRKLLARGGKIKTSLQGQSEGDLPISPTAYTLVNFQLEQLDLVKEFQAALQKVQTGIPHATSESVDKNKETVPMVTTPSDVPAAIREQIIKEAREQIIKEAQLEADVKALQQVREQLSAVTVERDTATTRIAEMEKESIKATETITKQAETIATFESAAFEASVKRVSSSFTEKWSVTAEKDKARVASFEKNFNRTLIAEIGTERNPEAIQKVAENLWESDFKELAEGIVQSISGGGAYIAPQAQGGKAQRLTDEQRREMGARLVGAR